MTREMGAPLAVTTARFASTSDVRRHEEFKSSKALGCLDAVEAAVCTLIVEDQVAELTEG
jgi:hypothetical protein